MGIGDSMTMIGCLAGTMLAMPALLVMLSMFFPQTTTAAAARLQYGTILPFFVGLFPAVILTSISTLMLSIGSVAQFCGSILYLGLFLWAFVGLASLSQMIGMTMFATQKSNVVLESALGAFILTFAIAFPLVGWFVILPIGVIIGVGATIIVIFNRWFGAYVPQFGAPELYPVGAMD